MSKLNEIDPPYLEEIEDIDELNDETFGCDLNDINDDWEEAHEKLASVDGPFNLSQSSKSSQQRIDYSHPDCEDIVKSSISNFFIEDNLYDDDFNSYDIEQQNVVTKPKTKKDKKSINLDSLRPPSPSILPFDDQFMSSVWRPLSPELPTNNHQLQKQQKQQLQHEHQLNNSGIGEIPHAGFAQSLPKQMKILTLEELEKDLNDKHHQNIQMQQQQKEIQQQKNNINQFNNFRPMNDRFSSFMSQREKDWLIKIFRLQCKVKNPYVEDYYEVNFKVKKATNERRKFLAKQLNRDVNDEEIDKIIESDPMIVLPELAKMEEEQPKYIQFDNTLGKIQMLNTKCPRKLLDMNPDKPNSDSSNSNHSSNSFYAILAKIEILYEHLLNIEDEDKRMPILPEHIKPLRLELRVQLCQQLFEGIVRPIASSQKGGGTMFALINRTVPTLVKLENEVDPDILSVSKGALLVYRSLLLLRKEDHFVVLLCSLVKSENCKQLIDEAYNNLHLNIDNMLIKALARIKEARNLIYITAAIDDIEQIVLSKFGHRFLVTIFKQYNNADDKLLFIYFWKLFVQALVEKFSAYVELSNLCKEHLNQLNEL